jgi:serine/threonine-protein kinase RsbW
MKIKDTNHKVDEDTLIISSDLNEIKKVEVFSQKISKKALLDEDKSDNLAIVLTELVNNAILHGNKKDPQKKVTLKAYYYQKYIRVSVRDQGNGFNPNQLQDPTDPVNLWKESGRGIFLVKNLIDKVEFFPSNAGTEIVITQYLN